MCSAEKKVRQALEELLRRDSYLLEVAANERSITHRLALYLDPLFPDWDVDCEYNRNHDDPKQLQLEQRGTTDEDLHATTIYPDIIIHRRATDENYIVIEAKKSNSLLGGEYDRRKLHGFREELGYRHAFYVCLSVGSDNPGIREFEKI